MHSLFSFAAVCMTLSQQLLATPVTSKSFSNRLSSRQTADTCTEPVHLVVGGGDSTAPGVMDDNSLLQTLIDDINNAYPGTTEYLVPYDGSPKPGPAATSAMESAIQEYAASCPNVPIVLLGYSFGGIITMNSLCGGVSSQYTANIAAAITYGEETQVADQPYSRGTCPYSAPLYARADPSTCAAFAEKILGFCDYNDPQCCAGGTDWSVHAGYAANYDSDAFAFIQQKLSAFGA